MEMFEMNGLWWGVLFVKPNDKRLIDRTGVLKLATTDPETYTIYLSNRLYGNFLMRVLLHELGHCTLVSYNLIEDIHRVVYPEYWIDAEEWVCNIIADYGFKIFSSAFQTLGYNAWKEVPKEIGRYVA